MARGPYGKYVTWKSKFLVDIYRMACDGLKDYEIAEALGIPNSTFAHWKKSKSSVRYALKKARTKEEKTTENLLEYVYERLPPDLQEFYDKISKWTKNKNGYQRVRAMLANKGEDMKKHLFLYAIVKCNFNPSKACKQIDITKETLDRWVRDDPTFSRYMEQVEYHTKNFLESALFKLVKKGDTAATIFANKAKNRDRGYGDKTEIEIKGEISHSHTHLIEVDVSKLSVKAQREVYDQIEEREEAKELDVNGNQTLQIPHKKGVKK